MTKIMIIEDEAAVRDELGILLTNAGYEICAPDTFSQIIDLVTTELPALILLDINLPGDNGYELCKKIRKFSNIPIVFITSQNNSMDELKALTLGGDDYITKPYNVPVLMARIQTVLRRNHSSDQALEQLTYQNITLDLSIGKVSYQNKDIDLTKNELKTLYFLFKNKEKFVSRADIIDFLWDNQVYIDDNSLSVNITRIREKLKQLGIENLIQTKRGMGYRV